VNRGKAAVVLIAVAILMLSSFVYAGDPVGSENNPYEGLPSPTFLVTGLSDNKGITYCGVDIAVFYYDPAIDAYRVKDGKVKRQITNRTEITLDLGRKSDYVKGVKHFIAMRTLYTPIGCSQDYGKKIIIADEAGSTDGWIKIPNSYFILSFFTNWNQSGAAGPVWHTDTWAENLDRFNEKKFANYGSSAALRSGDTFWLGEKLIIRVVTDEVVDSVSAFIDQGDEYRLDIDGLAYEETYIEDGEVFYVYTGELWSPDMYTKETWGNYSPIPIDVHMVVTKGDNIEQRTGTVHFDNRELFYRLRKEF
jgi:hypothetical protein